MRVLLLVVWLLIPVGALAFHLGPGQNHMKLDAASQLLQEADALVADENWAEAQLAYEKALANIPDDETDLRIRVQLKRAKVQLNNSQLPQAYGDLKSLVATLNDQEQADTELLSEARASLANSQYYMTWLKRLEGQPRSEWEPDIESAQQTFRLLAKEAESVDNQLAFSRYSEDLEASVRLARMDLGELQGLPLPSQ